MGLTLKTRGNYLKGDGQSLTDFKQNSLIRFAIQSDNLDSMASLKKKKKKRKRLETRKTVDYCNILGMRNTFRVAVPEKEI